MFILRQITDQAEKNLQLGKGYDLIYKETKPEEFKRLYELWGGKDDPRDEEIYAFVSGFNNELAHLYKSHENYIMTSEGQTFSNITFR